MAAYPCVVGPHRHRLKNGHLYPALLNGLETRRANLRMCPQHMSELLERLEVFRVDFDQLQPDIPEAWYRCATCDGPVKGESSSLFVTAYFPGQERQDYALQTHRACEPPPWTMLDDGPPTTKRVAGPHRA